MLKKSRASALASLIFTSSLGYSAVSSAGAVLLGNYSSQSVYADYVGTEIYQYPNPEYDPYCDPNDPFTYCDPHADPYIYDYVPYSYTSSNYRSYPADLGGTFGDYLSADAGGVYGGVASAISDMTATIGNDGLSFGMSGWVSSDSYTAVYTDPNGYPIFDDAIASADSVFQVTFTLDQAHSYSASSYGSGQFSLSNVFSGTGALNYSGILEPGTYDLYFGLYSSGSGSASGDFEMTLASAVPVPAAVWLFASGLLGMIGVARRKLSA